MKKDPYKLYLANASLGDYLNAIMSNSESELVEFAQSLNDQQFVEIAEMSSNSYRGRNVQAVLVTGGVLHSMSVASVTRSKKEIFELLLEDMEISTNQGYRCMSAFRCFGKPLLSNEKLRQKFVPESVKLLSGLKVKEEARQLGLKMAGNGERITIKKAKALIAQFETGVKKSPKPTKKPRPPRKRPSLISKLKTLVDKVSTEFQKPQPAAPSEDVDLLIDRLEGLLGQLKARRPSRTKSSSPTRREHANV